MNQIPELKHMLRHATKQALNAWPEEIRRASDESLRMTFLAQPLVKDAARILLFYGTGTELETAPLLPALWAMGKEVYLPRCLPQRKMEAKLVTPDCRMEYSAFGILEPAPECPAIEKEKLDLILVPAVCYDRLGYRLGQGGGYYDRYLADYQGKTIGLCRVRLLQERLPREAHDVPVELVLTESGPLERR